MIKIQSILLFYIICNNIYSPTFSQSLHNLDELQKTIDKVIKNKISKCQFRSLPPKLIK
jgi:hypothetical protein